MHNNFQGISFGAGPEVRPEKSVIMRLKQRHIVWVRCLVYLV